MSETTVKLIWSMSACNFCPRSDVRTCQIKPGKLLSKLSSALDLEESILDSSEGICTCCLADVDMIIRSVAIRGAMKDYYMDVIQNLPRSYDNSYINANYQGKAILTSPDERRVDNTISYDKSLESRQQVELSPSLLLPPLFARPPFTKVGDVMPGRSNTPELPVKSATTQPLAPVPSAPPVSTTKKPNDRRTRYQCMLCDKIAASKAHCLEHLICHSTVRPFTCSQCMKTYKSRKSCREHLIVMHGVEKVEENLQRLVLVDHDDLQHLNNVYTQYRKICSNSEILPEKLAADSRNSSFMLPPFKEEWRRAGMADRNMGISALPIREEPYWLPPLLQCLPSAAPFSVNETVPPPSKRSRKGTPHKLIHEYSPQKIVSEKLKLKAVEDSNGEERSLIESNKLQNVVPRFNDEVSFYPSQERHYSNNINQPFFPSFQTYKTEPLIPPSIIGYLPTGRWRRNLPPCQICGRCFPTKEKMADHMRSHSEVKQFSCLVCNRFFKYRRGVTNHLKEVHHMTNRDEISAKVASHEVGCIVPPKSKARDRKRKKTGRMLENCQISVASTDIIQKVIEDTLSSLADIQPATGNPPTTSQVTSDEESDGEHDDSMSPTQSHTLHYEATDESLISVDDGNGTISSSDENPMINKGLECESVTVGASTQIEDLSSPTGATSSINTVLSHGAVNC